jgi:hypothetical protein
VRRCTGFRQLKIRTACPTGPCAAPRRHAAQCT